MQKVTRSTVMGTFHVSTVPGAGSTVACLTEDNYVTLSYLVTRRGLGGVVVVLLASVCLLSSACNSGCVTVGVGTGCSEARRRDRTEPSPPMARPPVCAAGQSVEWTRWAERNEGAGSKPGAHVIARAEHAWWCIFVRLSWSALTRPAGANLVCSPVSGSGVRQGH